MSELTTTQKTILEAAAGRADGSIHPLPERIKGGAARKVLDSLRTKGLIQANADCISEAGLLAIGQEPFAKTEPETSEDVKEVQTTLPEEAEPETNEDVQTTDKNLLAIAKKHFDLVTGTNWPMIRNALEEAYTFGFQQAATKPPVKTTRKDSKQAQVIALMKRPEGVTAAQIAEATGWQNHTIRGFIAVTKKKFGLEITVQRTRTIGPLCRYRHNGPYADVWIMPM